MFNPASYLSLLSDGPVCKLAKIYSEKDVTRLFGLVSVGLDKGDDWQARIAALCSLQGIALGDGLEFDCFLPLLKGCHEQVFIYIYFFQYFWLTLFIHLTHSLIN